MPQSLEELFDPEKHALTGGHYFLLALSSLIIAAGLFFGRLDVVVGGALIMPVLVSAYAVGLGALLGHRGLMRHAYPGIIKSFLAAAAGGALFGLFSGMNRELAFLALDYTFRVAALYALASFVLSGAAAYAWGRRWIGEVIPGFIAAIALVPPLALAGVGVSTLAFGVMRYELISLACNAVSVVVGSFIGFSLVKKKESGDDERYG